VELYLHSPIRLHGVILKHRNTCIDYIAWNWRIAINAELGRIQKNETMVKDKVVPVLN
jgi:hypothetical protein